MIQVQGLGRSFPVGRASREILTDIELQVRRGEFVAIMGSSGSGKTTLLNAIGGLDRGYHGSVKVDGQDLAQLDDDALSHFRNREMGFVFQSFHLLDHLSCTENVALPWLFAAGDTRTRNEAHARAEDLLDNVGLAARRDELPRTLSGGEKQRVAIARAMFNEPRVLLGDEPTGNLDLQSAKVVLDLLTGLARDRSLTLLLVTHEESVSSQADRVVQLRHGKLDDGTGDGNQAP